MRRLVRAFVALVNTAAFAAAAPITVTQSFVGTGKFAGTDFTDALVTLTFQGDTTDRFVMSNTLRVPGTATVEVSGLDKATFTNEIQAVVNQNFRLGGISDVTLGFAILLTSNLAIASYDLASSLGPVQGDPLFNSLLGIYPIGPSGTFTINQIAGPVTYTAVVREVPEPLGVLLLGTGAAALVARRRRQRRVG